MAQTRIPAVFMRDVGLAGTELPDAIETDAQAMRKLGAIRLAASVAMGIARSEAEAATRLSNPVC